MQLPVAILLVTAFLPFPGLVAKDLAALYEQESVVKATPLRATSNKSQELRSGNPIIPGWYADPEIHIFRNEYWIYPTYSAGYDEQVFLDAFSSKDLVTWKKQPRIFTSLDAPWVKRALW